MGAGKIPTEEDVQRQKMAVVREDQQRLVRYTPPRQKDMLNAQKVKDLANANGLWIYHKEANQWFTPEEFEKAYANYYRGHPLFNSVQLKNPLEGIEAGYKQLYKLQEKLREFSLKVVKYYTTP